VFAHASTPTTPILHKLPHIMPEFDRLYLDMNGIIHCASHNNSEEELEKQPPGENGDSASLNADSNPPRPTTTGLAITEDQIFQNVCYYLDRIVSDIVQPKQLVFLAIDGVAPRAKLNQQRSRRYRSGSEKEIEMHLMTLQRAQQGVAGDVGGMENVIEADGGGDDGFWWEDISQTKKSGKNEVSRGAQRFSGTIVTGVSSSSSGGVADAAISVNSDESAELSQDENHGFHSNCITPGTPFLYKCSQRILEFIRHKLQTDPKWHDLTIIFSGHDVPGEGEHKIMDFMRHEKNKPGYDPNLRHCIYGQDGDLVMLGLATHEPHLCLLREEVVFDFARRKVLESMAKLEHQKLLNDGLGSDDNPPLSAAIQSYIHNPNFELLHMSVLRDYLALEFETVEFNPSSKFRIEPTIDDFVLMTFFVGNDFLPHMPALDIGDEAFDLLFYSYKKNRGKWLNDGLYRRTVNITGDDGEVKKKTVKHPYLTDAGTITSGDRLESFLVDVGSYEDPYYDNKRFSMVEDNERKRKADMKAGRESSIPSEEVLGQVELAGKELYRDMLLRSTLLEEEASEDDIDDEDNEDEEYEFQPVTSTRTLPQVKVDGNEGELINKLGGILRGSLSPEQGGVAKLNSLGATFDDNSLMDVKGRYYYDKFGFTPFDAEKHLALRKAYIAGLMWNLEYYYKGCVSWSWYYPYHYGPMLSDLTNINSMMSDISFFDDDDIETSGDNVGVRRVAGEPLRPFEQLLGCLPPSSSYLLPEPVRFLMTSRDSPLIE
jgi:5'-3' exonuclease